MVSILFQKIKVFFQKKKERFLTALLQKKFKNF